MRRVDILRKHMKEHDISAVVIPTADMHLSEYISDHFKLREYLSGFTGSAGTLVVTEKEAGLWTDGRYYLQAEKELLGSNITLYKASEKDCIKIYEFLKNRLPKNSLVGLDGRLFSKKYLDEFISKLENLRVNTHYDPAEIWENRPLQPMEKAFILEEKYSGENVEKKLSKVRDLMKKESLTHYLISKLECVMWLLNLRGNDVRYTPVMLSYIIMTQKSTTLYTKKEKLTREVFDYLSSHNIEVADYDSVYEDAAGLSENDFIGADFSLTNYTLINKLRCEKKDIKDFVYNLKCIKNNTEIENIKRAYIKENVALVKSFFRIYASKDLDECDVADIIENQRKVFSEYYYKSFDTIVAFKENAAIIHYGPQREKCKKIEGSGLLLIDTGGQYKEGTTDTTRTLAIGEITDEEKKSLTLVLKSHIALLTAVFPKGTRCNEIDALARMPLWKKGLDYRYSTGHGIGYFLSVHEGPQRLCASCDEVLKVNMTVSDEPGVYLEGQYGIRTENHLCVKEAFETEYGTFLRFEVLNFCPIGTQSLHRDILTNEEKEWVNNYNTECRRLISPYLTKEESDWLNLFTKTI